MNIKCSMVLFLAIALLLTGCLSGDKMDFYERTYSSDLLREEINGVALGSTEHKLMEVLGEPQKVEEVDNPPTRFYVYNDLEFQVEEGIITGYILSHENYPTARKIIVGDTKEDIIAAYGENYYERIDTGAEVIGYFDKQHNQNIEFTLNEGVLSGVMLSKINSGAK